MDKTVKRKSPRNPRGKPVVVLANWFQFGSSEIAVRPCVESRMFLWCVSGKGKIRANGTGSDFQPDDWVLLPWRHEIIYEACGQAPFFVGGIHIIPCHSERGPVVFDVAHNRTHALAGHPGRRDAFWPGMDKTVHGRFSAADDRLALLAAYIVGRYVQVPPARGLMTQLAALLVDEISVSVHSRPQPSRPIPGSLRQMQDFVRTHLDRELSVEDLARVARCSPSGVHRQFLAAESVSPGKWIARARAQRAAFLLRTTSLPVREVGEQVGMSDPFHFSRFFKRTMGLSPRLYRQDGNYL